MSIAVLGCRAKASKVSQVNETRASLSEVFHLRTECASLSRKLLEEKQQELAPFVEVSTYAWFHSITESSHYDPAANRCFVELRTQTTDRAGSGFESWSSELYDGQTKEVLAMTRTQVASGKYPKQANVGNLFVSTNHPTGDSYRNAAEYISRHMEDDRDQKD